MKNFAWWKWIIVGILGLVVWQFVINTGFISVKIIRGLSMVETLGSWLQTISSLMGLVILLVGLHFVYRWPGNGLQVIGLTRENWQKDVVIGMGVGLFSSFLFPLCAIMLRFFSNPQEHSRAVQSLSLTDWC